MWHYRGAPWDWRGFFGPYWLLGLHGAPIHPTSPVYRLILNVPLSWTTRLLTQPPMSTFTKPRGHGLNWVNMVCCVYESIYCVHVYDCFFYPALIPCISLICVLKPKYEHILPWLGVYVCYLLCLKSKGLCSLKAMEGCVCIPPSQATPSLLPQSI